MENQPAQPPQLPAGYSPMGQQYPLTEQRPQRWIGRVRQWSQGIRGVALYSDDPNEMLFLLPEEAIATLYFLKWVEESMHRQVATHLGLSQEVQALRGRTMTQAEEGTQRSDERAGQGAGDESEEVSAPELPDYLRPLGTLRPLAGAISGEITHWVRRVADTHHYEKPEERLAIYNRTQILDVTPAEALALLNALQQEEIDLRRSTVRDYEHLLKARKD